MMMRCFEPIRHRFSRLEFYKKCTLLVITWGLISGCGEQNPGSARPQLPIGPAPKVTADLKYTRRSIFSGPLNLDVNSLQVENAMRLPDPAHDAHTIKKFLRCVEGLRVEVALARSMHGGST